MSDPTRARINAAFDDELAQVPPGLRALSVRAAVTAPRRRTVQPALLALVAAVLLVALVVSLVVGAHVLRSTPTPAGSTTPPPPRAHASVAYDEGRGVMLLFGGDAKTLMNDTWTWDGKHWTQQSPAARPSARNEAAMAYDQAHHEVVLFGGNTNITPGQGGESRVDDTWTWNGRSWQEKHPRRHPAFSVESRVAMQFDPITRTVLVYGLTRSTSESPTPRPETWSWNGSDWTQLTPANTPANYGIMASDGRRLLLIAPSAGQVGGRLLNQTWAWDGSSWNVLDPRVNLPVLGFASAAYDPGRNQLVLLSGDTWTWDGSTWSRQHPKQQPPTVGYMVFMPSLHQVVSWGDIAGARDDELYGWDGSQWYLLAPGTVQAGPDTGGQGFLGIMSPAAATIAVRNTVKNTRPVLLPTNLAQLGFVDCAVNADADQFSIRCQSDQRDRSIDFGIVVANPPPGGTNPTDAAVKFRNAEPMKGTARGYAEYYVYDASVPTSQRWLMWVEPGTMTNPQLAGPGVPYFLAADGLTDAEFWQVANSLR